MNGNANGRIRSAWILPCLFLCASVPLCVHSAEPKIRVVNGADGNPIAIEAVGLLPEQLVELSKPPADDPFLERVLSLHVVDAASGVQSTAMAGRHEVVASALRFTPRYALRPGMKYEAVFYPPPPGPQFSPARYTLGIAVPANPPGEPTRVTAVYPTASVLPDNQLRFYLHFSAPMRQGEAYTHVKLLKADGQIDKRAFLEIGEELWDTSGNRLTLLFDPGRVKRGLKPREEFGPVLEPGREYKLVVDPAWRDEAGRPMVAGFEKRFTAGTLIEAAIVPAEWKVAPPPTGTREPLVVRFPRPLDHALLQWTITVENAAGKSIAGEIALADEERQWEFRPERAWAAGQHQLVVDATLEDTAGNSVTRPFEVDVFREVERKTEPQFVRVQFLVAAAQPVADPKQQASQKERLAKVQQLVGAWRGVGQPQRGSTKDSWVEEADWSWSFGEEGPALVANFPQGKYFRQFSLRANKNAGQFLLSATPVAGGQQVTYSGALDGEQRLVLTANQPREDLPQQLSFRFVAGGDRLLMLMEKKNAATGQLTRLAEVGYTRQGSGFGKGVTQRECVVTGGLGTIEVNFDGKTYYVCCTGCRDYFNANAKEVLAEYSVRK